MLRYTVGVHGLDVAMQVGKEEVIALQSLTISALACTTS